MSTNQERGFWTPDEIQTLTAMWQADRDPSAIAAVIKRSRVAVQEKARRLKLPRRRGHREWTPDRHQLAVALYEDGIPVETIARLMDTSPIAIHSRMKKTGVIWSKSTRSK